MKRLLASSTAAIGVVFGLFIFMIALIQQEAPATVVDNKEVVIFPMFIESPPVPEPPVPQEPTEVEQPPASGMPSEPKQDPKIGVDLPSAAPSTEGLVSSPGNGIANLFPNSDGDATSTVTIEPQYPPKAIQQNLEGWVKLGYDINSTGRVENVQVLAAKPRGVFEKSARRALNKWKYNPSVVDGIAVASIGHEVMLEFNLEKD